MDKDDLDKTAREAEIKETLIETMRACDADGLDFQDLLDQAETQHRAEKEEAQDRIENPDCYAGLCDHEYCIQEQDAPLRPLLCPACGEKSIVFRAMNDPKWDIPVDEVWAHLEEETGRWFVRGSTFDACDESLYCFRCKHETDAASVLRASGLWVKSMLTSDANDA